MKYRNKIEEIINTELQKKTIKVERITDEIMDFINHKFQIAFLKMCLLK